MSSNKTANCRQAASRVTTCLGGRGSARQQLCGQATTLWGTFFSQPMPRALMGLKKVREQYENLKKNRIRNPQNALQRRSRAAYRMSYTKLHHVHCNVRNGMRFGYGPVPKIGLGQPLVHIYIYICTYIPHWYPRPLPIFYWCHV